MPQSSFIGRPPMFHSLSAVGMDLNHSYEVRILLLATTIRGEIERADGGEDPLGRKKVVLRYSNVENPLLRCLRESRLCGPSLAVNCKQVSSGLSVHDTQVH